MRASRLGGLDPCRCPPTGVKSIARRRVDVIYAMLRDKQPYKQTAPEQTEATAAA